jgi:anaerobic selenocysteine-containing dehydrogenase
VFSASTDELVRRAFRGATGPAAAIDPATLRAAGPVKVTPYPDGQRFGTPSGRLEFYSATLAARGLPPMPDWREDPEETAAGRRWPLRLLTAPGYLQSHTAFSGNRVLRAREGPPVAVLHPRDAGSRGLAPGDAVELVNDRGRARLVLAVSDETQPGVVLVPGQRPAGETVADVVNVLCSDRYADLGEGATYQSTFLDVRRAG